MDIKRSGTQPSTKGSPDYFTGSVRIDPLFQATAPARAAGASVTFEPGARTAWHTHPLGQTLVVTAGCGLARHYWHLMLFRFGVGVGEATLSPSAYSLISDYFPPEQ